MPDQASSSPARLLAPLALGVFAVLFFAIILSAGSGGDGESKSTSSSAARTSTARKQARTTTARTTRPSPRASTYTVKVGDTLGSISETTGVSVQRLLDLNPDLDPQALVSGQKIKLRE
jgi:LysM repeat protein